MSNTLISILMPVLNAEETIEQSVQSVLSNSVDLELIVQDGGSNDKTLDIIKAQGGKVVLVSERDNGQSDALNRALARCNGEFIGWLNADDWYMDGALDAVVSAFKSDPALDVVYGNYRIVDSDGKPLRRYRDSQWGKRKMISGRGNVWSGALFYRRSIFERFGTFRASFHYAMDYEFMLRLGDEVTTRKLDVELGAFRRSNSSKSGASSRKFIAESYKARMLHCHSFSERLLAIRTTFVHVIFIATRIVRWSSTYSSLRSRNLHTSE